MTLYLEDIQEGDSGPELTTDPLTRTNFVRYAGASGDFNPMHHDDTYAQKAGRETVFGHGMYTAGLASRAIAEWVGLANVARVRFRFVDQVWPEDVLTVSQTVTEKVKSDDGCQIELDFVVKNQDDTAVLTGTATANVQSRA